jgi:hypothetical protein
MDKKHKSGSSSGNTKTINDFLAEEKAKSKSKEKVVRDFIKSKTPPKKEKKETDSKDKMVNPLTGRLVSVDYYNKLVKSGKIKEAGAAGAAKKESPPKPKSPPTSKSPPKPESPTTSKSPPTLSKKFQRNVRSKAGEYYLKAWYIVKKFKREGIKKQPLHPKQKEILDDVLNQIRELLNEDKGDDYEQMELPSLVDEILGKYAQKYNKHTIKKYIEPLVIADKGDYNTFQGQLDRLVDDIYDAPESETSAIGSSSSSSSSSGVSFKTNSSSSGKSSSGTSKSSSS